MSALTPQEVSNCNVAVATVLLGLKMVVSQNRETSIWHRKCYNLCFWDPHKGTSDFGKSPSYVEPQVGVKRHGDFFGSQELNSVLI